MEKIIISGEIGWEVWPDDVRKQLENANGKDIDIQIASPGGYVWDGLEVYNLIRDYKRDFPEAQILATIKGLAASMASYLAVNPVIDLTIAEDNAVFMIHNVWGSARGDYRDMRKSAEIFEGLTDLLGKAYMNKTGKTKDEIKNLMDDETWLFGSEIKEAGFVDDMAPSNNFDNEPVDKKSAITKAKMSFSAVSKKIHESENKADLQKIAAMIKPENIDIVQKPANAGKNITEVKTMTLEQFMAENPAAKIELDNQLKDKFEAGRKEGIESLQATIKTAAKYLGADSKYPAAIKGIAVDVLNGEKSAEALETTVSAFDALKESQNSDNAKDEAEKTGDTPGEQDVELTQNGIIKSDADFNAEVQRSKKVRGMEV